MYIIIVVLLGTFLTSIHLPNSPNASRWELAPINFLFFFPTAAGSRILSSSVICAVVKLGCWNSTAPLPPFVPVPQTISKVLRAHGCHVWPPFIFQEVNGPLCGTYCGCCSPVWGQCRRPFPPFGIHVHQFDKMLDNRCWSVCFDKEDTTLNSNDESLLKTFKSGAHVFRKPVWQLPLLLYFFKNTFTFCSMYTMLEIGCRDS